MTRSRSTRTWLALCALCVLGGHAIAQPKITYEQNVLPLLRDKCLSCHNSDKAKGGLDASTYGKLMEGGSSGVVVKPGDADGSRLYLLTAHKEEPNMPPKSPQLAKASLSLIKAWIEGGALENTGSKAAPIKKADVAVKVTAMVRPAVPPLPEKTLSLQPIVRSARANAVTALAASPWAPLAAVASPKQVLLYNTNTLGLVGVLPFKYGQVNVLKFSRSGELLLAAGGHGGKLGKVVLYSIKTGATVTEIGDEPDAITAADISPDQSEVAVGGPGRVVRVYSTSDGSKLRSIKKHTEWVTAIEYSPDGKLLATADRNGGMVLWEAATGREHQTLAGHRAAVTDLSWRDDSGMLASSSEEGNVKLWEPVDGKQTRAFGVPGVQGVKYTHNGRLVTTGRDSRTRLYNGNGAGQREYVGTSDIALKVAVTHDEGRVLAGDWTGAVVVWQLADGKKVGQFTTNPPTLAEQREIATANLTSKQKAVETAQAALKSATDEERNVQAVRGAAQTKVNITEKALADSRAAFDAAQRHVAALAASAAAKQREITACQVKFTAYTVACSHVQVEAAKAKDNEALAKAALEAKKLVDDTDKDLKAAQSARNKFNADRQTAKPDADKKQQAMQTAETALKLAKAELEAKSKPVKSANAKLAAAKAALDRATAERDAAQEMASRFAG